MVYIDNKISYFNQISLSDRNSEWGIWDQDDFAYANFEDDFERYSDGDAKLVPTCRSPHDHKFEKKILLNSYYRECCKCGYSPELDGRKLKFLETHKHFLEWESKNP